MRRILERNGDLIGEMRIAAPTSEQYAVFRSYLDARHRDGGMADMSVLDYAMMIEDSHVETRMIEYRRRGPDSSINGRGTGELLAVALTDVLSDGLSMVYSFFDSEAAPRSLGTFMILDHIARARRWAFRMSISATGCRARAKWITRAVSCRSNGSRPTAGSGWSASLAERQPIARPVLRSGWCRPAMEEETVMDRPGLIVAPLTPFMPDLKVDEPALRRQIDYVVEECGATMVVAAGVETQEYTYLSLDERKALIRAHHRAGRRAACR